MYIYCAQNTCQNYILPLLHTHTRNTHTEIMGFEGLNDLCELSTIPRCCKLSDDLEQTVQVSWVPHICNHYSVVVITKLLSNICELL